MKLTQFQCEENVSLKDISSYLVAIIQKKWEHKNEELKEENRFVSSRK